MAPKSAAVALSAHVKVRADLVEAYGFGWEYRPNYPTPPTEKRIQIRDEKHYTPSSQVTRYAAALKTGAKFPPPVFTSDGYLVDGNTTTAAYRKLGQLHMEALVLDSAWEGASDDTRQALRLLGAAANIANGRGLDKSEIIDAVLYVVDQAGGDHYQPTRIAALLGVTTSTVSAILSAHRARERARRLGLELNGSLTDSHLRSLGQEAGQRLNDGPFEDLVLLIKDSGMTSGELNKFSAQVKEVGDDAAQRDFIRQAREAMKPRIVQFKRTGKSRPSPAAQLRQCAGGTFVKHQDDPSKLVEYGPDAAAHLEVLELIAALVPQVILMQREAAGKG